MQSPAYSSCVPTLVVGYSVKARGIARDIFGTEDRYVLPVQSLQTQLPVVGNRDPRLFLIADDHRADVDTHHRPCLKVFRQFRLLESVTEQALFQAGVRDNVRRYPDPAFSLQPEEAKLPEDFKTGAVVGINISPMIIRYEVLLATIASRFEIS